ncbi:MAG: ATP-binding protein [Hydrogenoanaerobacterium sp.]
MKKLLILSGKGGTGKTTVAAAFIDFLNSKAFADCDVDAPNLHLVVKETQASENKNYYGGQKAIINLQKCTACGVCVDNCRFDAIIKTGSVCKINEYACEGCGVCFRSCLQGAVRMSDDIAGEQMLFKSDRVFSTAKLKMGRGNSGKLVTEVKAELFKNAPQAELAIIDGSPGVGCPVIASVSGVDLVLIVAEPSLSGISDMERIIKTTEILGTKAAICVNKYDISAENTDAIERFCTKNGLAFVGRIPYDKKALSAVNSGHSLAAEKCPARDALLELCKNTLNILEINTPENLF